MNTSSFFVLGLIILISISECLGQSCLRYFEKNPSKTILFFTGVLFYSVVCFLLVLSYKYKGMGIVNVLWSGISVLVILSVGILFFHEKITTMDKWGILFIIIGILLVMGEGSHDAFTGNLLEAVNNNSVYFAF